MPVAVCKNLSVWSLAFKHCNKPVPTYDRLKLREKTKEYRNIAEKDGIK